MFKRRIFIVDPDFFPLKKMLEIVHYLHSKTQKFGMFFDVSLNVKLTNLINHSLDD